MVRGRPPGMGDWLEKFFKEIVKYITGFFPLKFPKSLLSNSPDLR
jgi:hypothetical protein